MDAPEIVPQRQFGTLDEFIGGQNNFYLHFVVINDPGAVRRGIPDALINYRQHRAYFRRFQKSFGGTESVLTRYFTDRRNALADKISAADVMHADDWAKDILFESYKIMSRLIYKGDAEYEKCIINPDGAVDDLFLIR